MSGRTMTEQPPEEAPEMNDDVNDDLNEVEAADQADAVEQPAPVIPNRADQPVSEVAERFLRAIADNIPLSRIEELHLFSPLRQGTIETGIAVVAARVVVPVPAVSVPAEPEMAPELSFADAAGADNANDAVDASDAGAAVDATDASDAVEASGAGEAADASHDASMQLEDQQIEDQETIEQQPGESVVNHSDDGHDQSADMPEHPEEIHEHQADGTPEEDLEVVETTPGTEAEPSAPASIERHTVYTARYRRVIKGPERGRWETEVVEEADAPLVTVEMVVRGVQRRAGEDSEIVRFSARQVARVLRVDLDAAETPASATAT